MPDKALYRIFDYCWHEPYQFNMINALKDHCRFDYCLNYRKNWDVTQRPLPPGLKFVPHYEHGLYDFAIMHTGQGIYADDQHQEIYTALNEYIDDIPRIVIDHSTSIIPGMDPGEWWDLPKEPRVFTALPVQDVETYYNRTCLKATGELLYYNYGYLLNCANFNTPVFRSFDDYRNYLGRSLIYLDTSTKTHRNTTRAEAFLSGCCVVQVEGAPDIDQWAKNGDNVILVPNDAPKIAAVIADLLENRYEEARQIGQNGKRMAIELFNQERFRNDWLSIFKTLKS